MRQSLKNSLKRCYIWHVWPTLELKCPYCRRIMVYPYVNDDLGMGITCQLCGRDFVISFRIDYSDK